MSCREWEERIALQVEGDLVSTEVERHLESCAECRESAEGLRQSLAILREAHEAPLAEADYAEMRARVLERVQSGRSWIWWPAWGGAATVAALVAGWLLVGRTEQPRPARPNPAPQVAVVSQPPAAAVVTPVARHVQRKHRAARKPPAPPAEPLLVKLITDDPDVVIYWIVDDKGD